ncbi:MAG: PEP-CTERM sorting domain-containing protein [Gemmataceae bacterium]
MRPMLLTFVAALYMISSARASAVLGFAQGNTQSTTYDPSTPESGPGDPSASTSASPAATYGTDDFSPGLKLGTTNGGTIGTSMANPLQLTQGQYFILQIQMVDYPSYTFQSKLVGWAVRLTWNSTPGKVSAAPEIADVDGNVSSAYNVGINSSAGQVRANINSYNNYWTYNDDSLVPTPNSLAVAGVVNGATGWPSPPGINRLYVLANVTLHADNIGSAVLSIVDPRPNSTDFQIVTGQSEDSFVFSTIPQLFIHVVPEPSSLIAVGFAVSACTCVIRKRRKS